MAVEAFEEEFARALRNSAELAPDPPGETLALAAEARGQARRGRRRASLVAGAGALGLMVLASAGHIAFPGGNGDKVKPGGPRGRITGEWMSQTLRALMPAGTITDEQGFGIGQMAMPDMGPTAWLQFDDGHGSVQVNLSTDRVDLPIGADTNGTKCQDPYDTPIESCERTVRPDGSIVTVTKGLPWPPAPDRSWVAIYTGTDGRQVRLSERDYHDGTSAGLTKLPLTPEQLISVITSSAWDPLFEDFRRGATGRPTAPEPVGADPQALLATLKQLLPTDVTPGEPGAQPNPGRAHIPISHDGRTGSLVVQVQPNWADTDEKRRSFGTESGQNEVARADDGTVSVIRLTGSAKGKPEPVLYWEAEVLKPNGTLITVAQVNSTTWHGAQPGTPVLTTEQLRTIALSPLWLR